MTKVIILFMSGTGEGYRSSDLRRLLRGFGTSFQSSNSRCDSLKLHDPWNESISKNEFPVSPSRLRDSTTITVGEGRWL